MMMSILSVLYIVNVYFFWAVPWFELFSGIFHVTFFFVYMGILLGYTKNKHSADFVFFSRVDSTATSGWETGVVSWHLGLLTPIWTFCGFDAAVHLSEETRKARLTVPRVIFWSIFSNGIFAICMIVATLYCAGDVLDTALNSPFPFVTIAQQATGSTAGATWMGAGLIFMAFAGSLGSMVSVSRLTWAWARDRGFGRVSSFFAAVNSRRIPERAVALSSVATVILSVPNVKSTIAFAALTSLSTLALYLSYAVAIGCMLLNRFAIGSQPAVLGEWNLGRWGGLVNAYAIAVLMKMDVSNSERFIGKD
ncbi:putative amino acid permease protein [Neofusicoccum parvum]|nr:putative amino acid permease protein [Neofusicoccum parvum]